MAYLQQSQVGGHKFKWRYLTATLDFRLQTLDLSMNEPPIPAVQTFGLTRMYGNIAALSELDLTVNKGDLFGFIGSNGAGKTTTLRILATFLAPVGGHGADPRATTWCATPTPCAMSSVTCRISSACTRTWR